MEKFTRPTTYNFPASTFGAEPPSIERKVYTHISPAYETTLDFLQEIVKIDGGKKGADFVVVSNFDVEERVLKHNGVVSGTDWFGRVEVIYIKFGT